MKALCFSRVDRRGVCGCGINFLWLGFVLLLMSSGMAQQVTG